MNLQILIIGTILTSFACSSKDSQTDTNKVEVERAQEQTPSSQQTQKKQELEKVVQGDLVSKNEEGEVTDIQGFEKAQSLRPEAGASNQDLRDMYANEEKVFEFTPPEGVSVEFSEPNMVTGASLYLANNFESTCTSLAYQEAEPNYKQVVEIAHSKNVCGTQTVNFCIRMLPAGFTGAKSVDSYVYTPVPSFSLDITCKEDSFKDLALSKVDGQVNSEDGNYELQIEAKPTVSHIYLTSISDCNSGGEWEFISDDIKSSGLEFSNGQATVYAKFKDIFEAESECTAYTIYYADKCVADDPNYLAENILAGMEIGGLAGEANLACTSDGQIGCIASNDYQAEATSGLAAKVFNTQSVGGITGSIAPETHSDCTAGGQDDCITTATYASMDLSTMDGGGAVDLTNSNFSTHVKTAAIMEFWDDTGTRYTAVGDADITEANVLDSAEIFGITGTAGAAPDCSSIAVGGTWILVPGDPDYGTNDFCVMKYEAKNNSNAPESVAAGTPWVNIDQQDSKTECASLGKGYHLITNDEWMTIAANAANVGSNWSNGTVGDAELTKGHSDNNPANACAADASDANAYVETDCTGSASGTFNQRRTHTLSNGEVIWDLAGNVREWTSYFNDSDKPYDDSDSSAPVAAWREYTLIDTFGSSMTQTDLIPQAAITGGWSSSESIGQYYAGTNGSGGALSRGGYWSFGSFAGLFYGHLNGAPTSSSANWGFRCVVASP